MANNDKTHIFVVDDDSCILDAVCLHLRKADFRCTCFSNAEDCLQQLKQRDGELLITDVRMPEKDGIELLLEVKRIAPWLPVLVMTSYGDVPLAVKTIKTGAIDFIEKPLEWDSFLEAVRSAVKQSDLGDFAKRGSLTKTEIIVLRLILQGRSNKDIANLLCRSVRTVEVHRGHIMHKLHANNAIELVRRVDAMGLNAQHEEGS